MTLTNPSNTFPNRRPQRRQIRVESESLIQTAPLKPDSALPLLVQPALETLSLADWVLDNHMTVARWLEHHGGILFRGFQVQDVAGFNRFIQKVASPLMPYLYGSTPRTHVKGSVYTSTEYPANRSIPLHNEMAYARQWPLRIAFYCQQATDSGGETPIADSRRVLARLPLSLRSQFQKHGVLYVRNYGGGFDLSWQDVFQTEDPRAVEAYCRQAQIRFTWYGHDQLQTQQVCQAVVSHPHTDEAVWFNQAHLFNINTLEPTVRENLLATMAVDKVPRNTFYGDGTEITTEALNMIYQAYDAETITFSWQSGDVLLLDNLLSAHGRRPFKGARQVFASMGIPWESQDLGQTLIAVATSPEAQ